VQTLKTAQLGLQNCTACGNALQVQQSAESLPLSQQPRLDRTENMLDVMALTAGLTTNSTEESAVARHLHITVSQRVGGP
jgi:hypothetical protein